MPAKCRKNRRFAHQISYIRPPQIANFTQTNHWIWKQMQFYYTKIKSFWNESVFIFCLRALVWEKRGWTNLQHRWANLRFLRYYDVGGRHYHDFKIANCIKVRVSAHFLCETKQRLGKNRSLLIWCSQFWIEIWRYTRSNYTGV